MNNDDIIRRGKAAEILLADVTFNAVMTEISAHLAIAWMATEENEIREREQMYKRAMAVDELRTELKNRRDDYVKLQAHLEVLEKRKKAI